MASTLPFVVYGASTSGVAAAWRAANMGSDVDLLEGSIEKFYMWVTGLTQTDRENTFGGGSAWSMRFGVLSEVLKRAGKVILPPDGKDANGKVVDFILIAHPVMKQVFDGLIADFAAPQAGKGVIRMRLDAPLQSVQKDPQTKAIKSITCGGTVYPGLNFHDATDEGDLIAMAGCMLSFGRNGSLQTGNITSGVRAAGSGGTTTARSMNLTTGRRHKFLRARSSKNVGDADRKSMAYNFRMLVTRDAGRIKWEDINVYGFNPANYDLDYEIAKDRKITKPYSISGKPMQGSGTYGELDMNNGGLGKIGNNWIGRFLTWHNMTHEERLLYKGDMIRHKIGLFKDIATGQRWRDLPAVETPETDEEGEPLLDENGNQIITIKHIVDEVKAIGLIPGYFTKPGRASNTAYALNDIVQNNGLLYRCIKAGTTGPDATTAPMDMGLSILDGSSTTGVRWKYVGAYVAGMSPMIYVREGRRPVGQDEMTFNDMTDAVKVPREPMYAFGYPHIDSHWKWIYANERGYVNFEGGSGLSGGQKGVVGIMKWGALKARYVDCPNLTFSRATSGTWLGWIQSRIELPYIKAGDVCGLAAGVGWRLNKYTGDLNHGAHLRPELIALGAILDKPEGLLQ